MIEVHAPRTLDAAAEGPPGGGSRRGPRHDAARETLSRRLGVEEAGRLMADGAATSVDDSLTKIAGWLRVG